MENILVIGIAGGSGSGKTTLTTRLAEQFPEEVTVIRHDDYYKHYEDLTLEERKLLNYDHPNAFDTELLIRHLMELKQGRPVECPVYDYAVYNRSGRTRTIQPRQVVIVEGILIFQNPTLRDMFDIKIFVETDADVRILRRALRDVEERGAHPPVRSHPVSHHRQAHARAVCGAKPEIRGHHRSGRRAESGGAGDDHAAHPEPHRHPLNS